MKILIALLFAFAQEAQVPAPAPAPASQLSAQDEEFEKAAYFGRKFFDIHDYAGAYEQFAKADALKPDHPGVLYNMALVLAKAGRYSDAQVKADRYIKIHPAGAERPLVARLQRDLEFQRELQKKRQSDQDYAELFNRGKFLYGKADLDAALKLFQESEQLRPNDPAAVFNQAVIHEKQGDLAKAAQRFRRFGELERSDDEKAGLDQKLFALDSELEDMRTKIVCSFCGHRLREGATWCHRCWHGPYLTKSAVWNTRPCADGASATRATYFADGRFAKNDQLPCIFPGTSAAEALRYSPRRQRAIQDARKAEGWTYNGEVIQGWGDKQGNQVRYAQGPDYLEKILGLTGGESLVFSAHEASPGVWLLDREDVVIDGMKYTSHYTFDSTGRIAQQQVEYQNTAACNHIISAAADYAYQGDQLTSVKIAGGYDGFVAEGSPKTQWQATVGYTYDDQARVAKEELAVTSFEKVYNQKAIGAIRDEIGKLYPGMRLKKPVEAITRVGDVCASGLANPIDLRPFYAMSPNLAVALPAGVTKATVSFVYP
jgi:tetratricopeptide (TPR) repeat protein